MLLQFVFILIKPNQKRRDEVIFDGIVATFYCQNKRYTRQKTNVINCIAETKIVFYSLMLERWNGFPQSLVETGLSFNLNKKRVYSLASA